MMMVYVTTSLAYPKDHIFRPTCIRTYYYNIILPEPSMSFLVTVTVTMLSDVTYV